MQPTEFRTGVIKPIECAKEAWEIIKPDYWLLMAIVLVGAVTSAITLYVLVGAMASGIMLCYLKRIDGEPVAFDNLWQGLKFFWPSLPVTLLIFIPVIVWMVVLFSTIYMPIIMAAVMGDNLHSDQMLSVVVGALVVDFIVAIVMICFHTLLTFSIPLVVDRGLTAFKPATVSARAVLKNVKGIGGLIGVNFVLALIGEAMCGIGIYLVIPLIVATSLVAYRKVFPRVSLVSLNPSPPNLYSELR